MEGQYYYVRRNIKYYQEHIKFLNLPTVIFAIPIIRCTMWSIEF